MGGNTEKSLYILTGHSQIYFLFLLRNENNVSYHKDTVRDRFFYCSLGPARPGPGEGFTFP